MRNLTALLAPSLDDLIDLPHRASERVKQLATYYGLDIFNNIRSGGFFIAENTANRSNISATLTKKSARETLAAVASSLASGAASQASPGPGLSASASATSGDLGAVFSQGFNEAGISRFMNMMLQFWKSLGGVLPYVMSKWAIVTLLMGFVINRTQFYASSRIPLRLWWPVRVGIFLMPLLAVLVQVQWVLAGIRCQTSQDFVEMRYGNASEGLGELDYAGEGGILYGMTTVLLPWATDREACLEVQMISQDNTTPAGSMSLLWPLFLSLSLAAFSDTLATALQGRPPLTDLSLLELSFAFNEAESMVVKVIESAIATRNDDGTRSLPTSWDRKEVLRHMNTSPDMLLISFIWAMSSLTSMTLSIFGKRHQYRLLNTGFWGIAYFTAISRSIYLMWQDFPGAEGFWHGRIPLILLMGFMPHFIVVTGMLTCAIIYGAALTVTAFSLPPTADNPRTVRHRLSLALQNLQANVQFSNGTPLSFKMTDDFYTALLNAGFTILTAASEAVYLNEGAKVRVGSLTWLEQKRIQELQQGLLFQKTRQAIPSGLRAAITDRVEAAAGNHQPSGYGVERKIRGQEREDVMAIVRGNTGLAVPRRSRFAMAVKLITGTFWLVVGFNTKMFLLALGSCGVTWRPRIIQRLIGDHKKNSDNGHRSSRTSRQRQKDLIRFPDGEIVRLRSDNKDADIEEEFRKRSDPVEDADEWLYGWWKTGGFWGETDSSGDYVPTQRDDDLTSMVSFATDASHDDDAWGDEDDSGRRTPTPRNPYPSSREATPFEVESAFDSEQLAMLLDPKSPEQQHEARLLARRLRHGGIMTRSQYNRELTRERAAILSSSRYGQHLAMSSDGMPLSAEAEEAALEDFILARRRQAEASNHPTSSGEDWAAGAAGMGSSGPQCVVCQDSPRTVLLWPCGCLCLCDDCRVSMATRNFNSCICCRTNTLAYSRLYVP